MNTAEPTRPDGILILQRFLKIVRDLLEFFLLLAFGEFCKNLQNIVKHKSYKTIELFICHSHINHVFSFPDDWFKPTVIIIAHSFGKSKLFIFK